MWARLVAWHFCSKPKGLTNLAQYMAKDFKGEYMWAVDLACLRNTKERRHFCALTFERQRSLVFMIIKNIARDIQVADHIGGHPENDRVGHLRILSNEELARPSVSEPHCNA